MQEEGSLAEVSATRLDARSPFPQPKEPRLVAPASGECKIHVQSRWQTGVFLVGIACSGCSFQAGRSECDREVRASCSEAGCASAPGQPCLPPGAPAAGASPQPPRRWSPLAIRHRFTTASVGRSCARWQVCHGRLRANAPVPFPKAADSPLAQSENPRVLCARLVRAGRRSGASLDGHCCGARPERRT